MAADPVVVNEIVEKLKSQGLFDRFRKQCLADIDTRPSYRNLMLRVESHVNKFLESQRWSTNLDEFQLREKLRRNISNTDVLTAGVEWIVDQVITPKIECEFKPPIDRVVCETLGVSHSKWVENQSPEKQQVADITTPNDGKQLKVNSTENFSPLPNSKFKSEPPRSNIPPVSNTNLGHFPVSGLGHLQHPPPTRPPPIPPFSNFPPPPPPPQPFSAPPPPAGFHPRLPPYLPPNFIPNHSGFMAPPPPPPPIVLPPLPPEEIPPPPPEEDFAPPPPPPPPEKMDEGIISEDLIEEEVTEENLVEEIPEFSEDIPISTNRDALEHEDNELDVSKDSNLATLSGKRHLIWEGVQLDLDDISDISVSSVHTSDLSEVDQIAATMSPNSNVGRRVRKRSSSRSDSRPSKSKTKVKNSDYIRQTNDRRSYKEFEERRSNREYKKSPTKTSGRSRQLYDDIILSKHRKASSHKRSVHVPSPSRNKHKAYRSSSAESHRSSSDFSGFSSDSLSSGGTQQSRKRGRDSTSVARRESIVRSKHRLRTKTASQSDASFVKRENHKSVTQPHSRAHRHGIKRESTSSVSELPHEIASSNALPFSSSGCTAGIDEKEIRRQQIQQRLQEIAAQQKLLQMQQEKEQQQVSKSESSGAGRQDSHEEATTATGSKNFEKTRRLSMDDIKPSKCSNSETEEGELSDSDSNSAHSRSRRPSSSSHKFRSSSRDTPSMQRFSRQISGGGVNKTSRARRSVSIGGSEAMRRYSSGRSSPRSGKLSSRSRSSSKSSTSSKTQRRIFR